MSQLFLSKQKFKSDLENRVNLSENFLITWTPFVCQSVEKKKLSAVSSSVTTD